MGLLWAATRAHGLHVLHLSAPDSASDLQMDMLEVNQQKLTRTVRKIEGSTSVSVLGEASVPADSSELASLQKTLRTRERHLKNLQSQEASSSSSK